MIPSILIRNVIVGWSDAGASPWADKQRLLPIISRCESRKQRKQSSSEAEQPLEHRGVTRASGRSILPGSEPPDVSVSGQNIPSNHHSCRTSFEAICRWLGLAL